MNFDQSVQEIEAFSGRVVEFEIWGPAEDSGDVAAVSGKLSRMGHVELPPSIGDAVGETAVTFIVGDATLNLWPSRFLGGDRLDHRQDWLEVRTRDALIRIGPKRPAWSD
jgi:hypothetical protein